VEPRQKGEISEVKILAKLIEWGVPVSIPFGQSQRYDFIIDIDQRLWRLQCKTAFRQGQSLIFATASRNGAAKKTRKGYTGQIDAFAVYDPLEDAFYLVTIGRATKACMTLRPEFRYCSLIELRGRLESPASVS